MTGVDAVAEAVGRIFRQQRASGRKRFGDWTTRLAEAMQGAVAKLYLSAAKSAAAKAENADSFAAIARARCLDSARSINATTGEMLARDEKPWTPDRIQQIAFTEAIYARSAAVVEVAKSQDQYLTWVTEKTNDPCDFCLRMNGRTVKAGKMFGIHRGEPIYHPGEPHPFCRCRVVVSGAPTGRRPKLPAGIVEVPWEDIVAGTV